LPDARAGQDGFAALTTAPGAPGTVPAPVFTRAEDPKIYAGTAGYPGALAGVTGDAVLRQQRVAGISVYPAQYRPDTRQLTVYESLRVSIALVIRHPPSALRQAPSPGRTRRCCGRDC